METEIDRSEDVPAKGRELSPLIRALVMALALLVTSADYASAISYNRVVSLGDSLLDEGYQPLNAPLVSQHLAQRLGASHTQLAQAGATTASLIATGQHTDAAASFGPGDLAVLWIGGNDFLDLSNVLSLLAGDYSFLDSSAANLDIILETLVQAGIDVLVLNLPDMAIVPVFDFCGPPPFCITEQQLPLLTAASLRWRELVEDLAASHGAAVADVYGFSLALQQDPSAFSFLGNVPVIGQSCELCIFSDPIHPSRLGQAYAANTAIVALNEVFDSQGQSPVAALSEQEIWDLVLGPRCGDGEVDPGEDCDDGGLQDGDCCSSSCMAEPAGASCGSKVELCYADAVCDGEGFCLGGEPTVDCEDANPCTVDLCVAGICVNAGIALQESPGRCDDDWNRALLSVRETNDGKESITLRLRDGPALAEEDFGDPSREGGTPYKLCVYDDQRLVAGFEVDRAGESCGDRECWHPKRKDRGWRYKDPDASSDGTHILDLKGGREGKSRLLWTARNDVERGQDSMPTGLAAALGNSDRVSVQLIAGEVPASDFGALRDQACFLRTFTDIEKQESDWFKAR